MKWKLLKNSIQSELLELYFQTHWVKYRVIQKLGWLIIWSLWFHLQESCTENLGAQLTANEGGGGEGGGAIALTMVNTITPVACFIQTIGSNIKAFFYCLLCRSWRRSCDGPSWGGWRPYQPSLHGGTALLSQQVQGYSTTLLTGIGVQHYASNSYRGTALYYHQVYKGIALHSQQVKGYNTTLSTDTRV